MQRPLLVMTLIALCGCGAPETAPVPDDSTATPGAAAEPSDAVMLETPFTAEQIRDEWTPGLRLLMRRSTPGEVRLERWTVLRADAEGCEIEFAAVDASGAVSGEPVVQRSTWVELRDHASFPAAGATREWVTRETALGSMEGWLYRVPDEGTGTISEFFFAPALPGAPVQMRAFEGEQVVFELEQVERTRTPQP